MNSLNSKSLDRKWIKNTVVFTVFIGAGLTSTHDYKLNLFFLGMCSKLFSWIYN